MEIPVLHSIRLGALEALQELGTPDARAKLMVLARMSPGELIMLASGTRGQPSTSCAVGRS